MAKNQVGTLIGKGMTTVQIQERIKDFPTNPTTEYFTKLGYTKSTATSYICKLRKNNLANQEKEQKNISSKNEKTTRGSFIFSENANKDNLILDTCALQNRDTIKIIDESSQVTILLSTLNEMEDLKRRKTNLTGRESFLQTMISRYCRKFLKETEKYRLVPFVGDDYNDTSILNYLMQQPVNERQTIITADILFATRASCLGLDYILYDREETIQNQETTISPEEEKKTVGKKDKSPIKKENEFNEMGVKTVFLKDKIAITKYNPKAQVFYVKGDKCVCITEKEKEIEKDDVEYVAIISKLSGYGCVKVIKEMVINQKLEKEENEYYYVNEIYRSEGKLHDNILECCKNLL